MMLRTEDRFRGSMLGLALGDACGAPHEGGVLAGLAWKAMGRARGETLRWTDDTQMALGLAGSLAECRGLDPDHLAKRWAENMDGFRGYGPGARELLTRIRHGVDWREANRSVFPDGSFGNGAAMRTAPLGLFFHDDLKALAGAASHAASITHAHPLGIEGAVLVSAAVALAMREDFEPAAFADALYGFCSQGAYTTRLDLVRGFLEARPSPAEIRGALGNSVLAHESSVTAIQIFLSHRDDFGDLLETVLDVGGDTDTIGAMAGGIFGAHRGFAGLHSNLLDRLEARDEIERAAARLYGAWRGTRGESAERR